MRPRSLVRRAALAGAAGSLLVALVGPGARAAEEPETFSGSASASVLDVGLLTPDLVPIKNLFSTSFGEGRSRFEPQSQDGRASLVYPGAGLVQGPDLLCGTFIAPQIPAEGAPLFGPILDACQEYDYPLSVQVDPLHPDASTDGELALGAASDPVSLHATGARARVGPDGASTSAALADLHVLGVPGFDSVEPLLRLVGLPPLSGGLVDVGGVTATTDQRIDDGHLVVEATATLSDLRLVGGLVRIGSIVSRSSLRAGGAADEEAETATDVQIGGVTVAGVPAEITQDGLVLGASTGTGPILQQLTRTLGDALGQIGLHVEVLPSERGEQDGVAFANSGGLVIELSTPITGLPPVPGPIGDLDVNGAYGLRLQVGTTGVRGYAAAADELGPDDTTPDTAFTGAPDQLPGGSVDLPGVTVPGGGRAPGGARPTVPGDGSPISNALSDRLALVYLAFTLGAVALCLSPRLAVPSRLPGPPR